MRINKIRISLLFANFFVMNKASLMSGESGYSGKGFEAIKQSFIKQKEEIQEQLSFIPTPEGMKSTIIEGNPSTFTKLAKYSRKTPHSISIDIPITHTVDKSIYETFLSVNLDYALMSNNPNMLVAVEAFIEYAKNTEKNSSKLVGKAFQQAEQDFFTQFFALVGFYTKEVIKTGIAEVEKYKDLLAIYKGSAKGNNNIVEDFLKKYCTNTISFTLDLDILHIITIGSKGIMETTDLSKTLLTCMNVGGAVEKSGDEKELRRKMQVLTEVLIGALRTVSTKSHEAIVAAISSYAYKANVTPNSLAGQVLKKAENMFKTFSKFYFIVMTDTTKLQESMIKYPSESVIVLASCIKLASIFNLVFFTTGKETIPLQGNEFIKISFLMSKTLPEKEKELKEFYSCFTKQNLQKTLDELIEMKIAGGTDVFTLQLISLCNSKVQQNDNTLTFILNPKMNVSLIIDRFNKNVSDIIKDNGIVLTKEVMELKEEVMNPYIKQQHELAKAEEEAKKGLLDKISGIFKKDSSKTSDKKEKKPSSISSPYGGAEEITEIKTAKTVVPSTTSQFFGALLKVLGKDISVETINHLQQDIKIKELHKRRNVDIPADYTLVAAGLGAVDTLKMDKLDENSSKVLCSLIGENIKHISLGLLTDKSIQLIEKEYSSYGNKILLSSLEELRASFDIEDCTREAAFNLLKSVYMPMAIRSLTLNNNLSEIEVKGIFYEISSAHLLALDDLREMQLAIETPADTMPLKTKNIQLTISEVGGSNLIASVTVLMSHHSNINLTMNIYKRKAI